MTGTVHWQNQNAIQMASVEVNKSTDLYFYSRIKCYTYGAPISICRKKKQRKRQKIFKHNTLFPKENTLYTLFFYQLNCYITFYLYIFPFVKFLPSV